MNSRIYRCGWCGSPTDKHGETLTPDTGFYKAMRIIKDYGDHRTHLLNGDCCQHEASY